MPRVPPYDEAQVREAPLSGGQQNPSATPELMGGAAAADQIAAGKAMLAASDAALQIQHQENLGKVQSADALYKEKLVDWKLQAKEKYQGDNADAMLPDFKEWHRQTVEEINKGFENDAQRATFEKVSGKNYNLSRAEFGTFVLGERAKSRKAAFEATTETEINLASVARTPEEVAERRGNLLKNIDAYAAANGIPQGGPVYQKLVDDRLTAFHAARIKNMVDGDYAGAKAYYEANKSEIKGTFRDDVAKWLKAGGEKAIMQRSGDDAIARGLTESEALAEAREKYKDPVERAAAEHGIVDRYGRDRQVREAQQRDAGDKAWKVYSQTGRLSSIPADVVAAMDGRDYESLKAHAEAKAKAGEKGIKTDIVTWAEVNDGIAAGSIKTTQDVLRYASKLSTADVKHFVEKVGRPDKVLESKIDKEEFEHFADKAGLKPFDPKKSEEERKALSDLKYKIDQRITERQAAVKRPLTPEERRDVMQRMVDDRVMTETFFPSDPKPTSMLTPDEMKTAYVWAKGKTGPVKVVLSKIPAEERAAIVAAARKHNVFPSEQEVAQAWLAKQEGRK